MDKAPFEIIRATQPADHRTIVVIGCSRGGTSMVAGTLRELGIFMGKHVTGANHEDMEFAISDRPRLIRLVHQRNEEHRIWGWKYPHAVDYLPDILPSLRNPCFLFVMRSVLNVARSFTKYHGLPLQKSVTEAIARYAQLGEFVDKLHEPLMLIDFEQGLGNRRQLVSGIADFLQLSITQTDIDRVCAFINPNGRYQHVSGDDPRPLIQVEHLSEADYAGHVLKNVPIKISRINVKEEDGQFLGQASDPQFMLDPKLTNIGREVLVTFSFFSDLENPTSTIYIDFGNGFYPLGCQNFTPRQGRNFLRIRCKDEMRRIRLDPLNSNDYFKLSDITVSSPYSE